MTAARWTPEQLADYERRLKRDGGTLGAHGLSAPSRNTDHARAAPRAQTPSRLELELAGHLAVMGLKPEQQYRFHPDRRWRLDFAFPELRLGVELDGGIFAAENGGEVGKHSRGAGRCADMQKRNAAAELGWLILNYGPPHVRTGEAALQIERIAKALLKTPLNALLR
jgi:very-short-patch-repair endonuclease